MTCAAPKPLARSAAQTVLGNPCGTRTFASLNPHSQRHIVTHHAPELREPVVLLHVSVSGQPASKFRKGKASHTYRTQARPQGPMDGAAPKLQAWHVLHKEDVDKMEESTQTQASPPLKCVGKLLQRLAHQFKAEVQAANKTYANDNSKSNWDAVERAISHRAQAESLLDTFYTRSRTDIQILQSLRELRNMRQWSISANKTADGKDRDVQLAAHLSVALAQYQECLDHVEAVVYGSVM